MRLIDADALLKALVRKEPFSDCARVVIAECMQEVRHAPTIEPERKTGKWINRWAQNGKQVKEVRECSECGALYLRYYGTADGFDCVPPRYCPNCGAKMEEGDRA